MLAAAPCAVRKALNVALLGAFSRQPGFFRGAVCGPRPCADNLAPKLLGTQPAGVDSKNRRRIAVWGSASYATEIGVTAGKAEVRRLSSVSRRMPLAHEWLQII